MATSPDQQNSRVSQSALHGRLWTASAAALVLSALSACVAPLSFWAAYLTAAVFWTGVSLGCLGIALLHRLTGGAWGWAIHRELNAATGALPVAVLSLAPLLFGAKYVFPWAGDEAAGATLNLHQSAYFAPISILTRTFLVIAVWCGLGRWCVIGNLRLATDGMALPSPRFAAIGLIALWLTITFAAIDALMSLTPGWASSIFGALHAMGFALTGLALAIVARTARLTGRTPTIQAADLTQDLGSLLLALNLLWAYCAFSEYLIIWSGDLPFEVNWFVDRRHGWNLAAAVALIVLHFVVPLACLLSRDLKRNPRQLAAVAGLLLLMELCHLAWTVLPAASGSHSLSAVFVALSIAAIGGPWLLVFIAIHRRFPRFDPGASIDAAADRSADPTGGRP